MAKATQQTSIGDLGQVLADSNLDIIKVLVISRRIAKNILLYIING